MEVAVSRRGGAEYTCAADVNTAVEDISKEVEHYMHWLRVDPEELARMLRELARQKEA